MAHLLFVPSPLLGPTTWRPVAAWARDNGHEASVVEQDRTDWRPTSVLAAIERAASGLGPVVLVPHSNAGLYVPRLSELLDLEATVFVDAALPAAGPETPLAPPAFLEQLRALTDPYGMLPPWTRWWDDVADLFPDDATRAAVEAEQRRLPLAYFTSRLPVPEGWADGRHAYLAFGDTYADELAFAQSRGWPTTTLDGRHLHQLVEPGVVGAAGLDLVSRLSVGGRL